MPGRRAILLGATAAWAALCCAGAGTPEETVEAFHGLMAAKDFGRAAGLVYFADEGAGEGRGEYAARLAEIYDESGFDYGRAEIRERRRLGSDEVEVLVSYPRRSRPSTPPVTRRVVLKRMRSAWYCIIEPTTPTEMPERPE